MAKQTPTTKPSQPINDTGAGGGKQDQIQRESGARPVGENRAANEADQAKPVPENQEQGGAAGQSAYRGKGGDRSQSGGPHDYGGGYGAGQGQLPYGYEEGMPRD